MEEGGDFLKDIDLSKLRWEDLNLVKRLTSLKQMVNKEFSSTPSLHTRHLSKLKRWQKQLKKIISRVNMIKNSLGPRLEKILGLPMKESELLLAAMFQPSTKNLFLELETEFCGKGLNEVGKEGFDTLASLSEMSKVLALIGDAAISLGVIHFLWQPRSVDSGHLTQRRAEIVSNDHMARVCDKWGLYKHRIHFDPPTETKAEIEHNKGTLLEAIYGIIYVEYGFDKVKELISKLVL
jgi:dsRNA-specific ribonuclease